MTAAADAAAEAVAVARDALDGFARTYGEMPLRLLLHAAVPQSFQAEMLNLLKINFVPEAGGDLSVDADVLLSPLVEAVGGGYRRLDAELRRQCLDLLDAAYRSPGPRRSVRVARFLLAYLDHVEHRAVGALDPLLAEYVATQRWVALAFIDPPSVAQALAENLRDQLAGDCAAVRARIGGVAAALTVPLSGHRALLDYARGVDALVSGDREGAERLLVPLGKEELRVGDIVLRPPSAMVESAKRVGPAAVKPFPPSPDRERIDLQVFRDVEAPWCPEMVALPAGEFLMGSPEKEEGRYNDEGPQHEVAIGRRFAIGRYPVTFYEYDHFCSATGRAKPKDEGWGRGTRPVINVSWQDATAYCEWLAKETGRPYRLPSEAEWEYACRAGTTTRYSWGDTITPKNANYAESRTGKTTKVGRYPANPWGLYDMHGNVWEWVEDVWHDGYKGAPSDGSAWTDGEGKESSRDRVIRGGSWLDDSRFLRSALRISNVPDYRNNDQGFRVARTLD